MNAEYYPITGIEGVFIAPVLSDTADTYFAGTVIECPPVENANWTSTQNSAPFFGNNAKQDERFGVDINSVVIRLNGVSEELDAKMRGKSYIAASGRVAGSGNTNPPLWALGLKINKGDEFVYIWFLKGRFSGGNVVAQTMADNVTINMREYTFAAFETTHKFTYTDAITSQEKTTGLTWFKGETADSAFSETGFFSQVQTPDTTGAPSAIALSTSVPAADATGISRSAAIVLTFNNKIVDENVMLINTSTGAVVAAAKSWDATGKILTLTPSSTLAATTLHTIVLANVTDAYGQALTDAARSFTTGS